jgi:hypothetical protein
MIVPRAMRSVELWWCSEVFLEVGRGAVGERVGP